MVRRANCLLQPGDKFIGCDIFFLAGRCNAAVPVAAEIDARLFEYRAIVAYLTDTFPQAGLAPKPGEAGRGQYLTMLAYYGDVVEPSFVSKFLKMDVPRGTAGCVVPARCVTVVRWRSSSRWCASASRRSASCSTSIRLTGSSAPAPRRRLLGVSRSA